MRSTIAIVLLTLTASPVWSKQPKAPSPVAPGARTMVMAHNAYPDHGKYADRLDRALAGGTPFVVEEDLAWTGGKSVVVHGAKNASPDDPTMETYFFPKVAPLMEKALREGNKGDWPLITLYLDIKNDPPEHLQAIGAMLDHYKPWLTTATKTADIAKQSPLNLRPMMVLVEDKQNDIKQQFFYDDVPAGGDIRVFGSVTKPVENPAHLPKLDFVNSLVSVPVETVTTQKADNYHRWWGLDWAYVEKGGEQHHGAWGPEQQARLQSVVDYGHQLGYLMSFYCLDGFTPVDNQGWEDEYNFGSMPDVETRWKAALRAHTDMISTDQYEALSQQIHSK